MDFDGNYVYVNDVPFPSELIAEDGYECIPNQEIDKNSYRDGRGTLHRFILPEKPSTVIIRTIDLSYSQKIIVKSFFIPRTVITMRYWNDETDNYETATFYVPPVKYIHKYQRNQIPYYKGLELEFIAYGGDIS